MTGLRQKKSIQFYGLGLIVIGLLAGFAIYILFYHHPINRKSVLLTVDKNQSIGQVTKRLQQEGVLKHPLLLKVALKVTGKDKKFRSGTFELQQPSSIQEIIHAFTKGKMVLQEISIPEGFTMQMIADLLAQKGITSQEAFLKACQNKAILTEFDIAAENAEGYLFPETYQFAKDMDAELVVQTMLDHLLRKITPEHLARAFELNLNLHQWVTLASIIEKEAANASEYRTIASVFHNRLARGMRLESDPTIIYGIPDYDGNIRKKHIRMPHPYNTYVIKGLPPGPIASPGWGALEATINPEKTDYLFFVADRNHKHVFSKTYKEHQKNVYEYQIKKK
ncbi:MAG: endolytic transglycosylase MltG [Deltaproteobacteria bacterium]|nr:endolytic transglycosylase MltG [Deltaproteobacteria bacterium]